MKIPQIGEEIKILGLMHKVIGIEIFYDEKPPIVTLKRVMYYNKNDYFVLNIKLPDEYERQGIRNI